MEDKIFSILDTLDAMNNPKEALRVHFKFPETTAIARAFAAEIEDCAKKSNNAAELTLAADFFNSITSETVLPETGNLSDNYAKITVASNNIGYLGVLNGSTTRTRQGFTSIQYNSQGDIVTNHSLALQDLFLTNSLNLYKYSNFDVMRNMLQQQFKMHPDKEIYVSVFQVINKCEEYLKSHKGELILNMYDDAEIGNNTLYFQEQSETQHVAEFYIGG